MCDYQERGIIALAEGMWTVPLITTRVYAINTVILIHTKNSRTTSQKSCIRRASQIPRRLLKSVMKWRHLGLLILYTAQSCSTAGEVNSTSLYSMHHCYSPGANHIPGGIHFTTKVFCTTKLWNFHTFGRGYGKALPEEA